MNQTKNILFQVWVILSLFLNLGRAETAVWSDGFEGGATNRWVITNTVWHIGSPIGGPATNAAGFRTHSGTNCASTANYSYNQDVRIICTNYNGSNSLVVPAASQFPRLRFWHWFNYQNALGFVEISTNSGTNWNQLSPTYQNNSSSGVWSRPSIDLSSFAGQSVQFAFRFDGGSPGSWYVDDVAVVTNSPVFNNPESFESGEGDWSVSAGTWEVGVPTSGPATNAVGLRAHSGTNCAATVLSGNYAAGVDSRLISPAFIVPATNSPALRFWHWYNLENSLGFVEISVNGGSWNQLSPTYQQNSQTGSTWTNVSLDLSAYAGQTVSAAFRFATVGSGTAAGWYVDDVTLVANPVLTVPATQTIYAGQSLNVTNYVTLLPTNGTPLFALISPPTTFTNLNLNSTNGVLTWNTTTAQQPSTNTITIKVTETNVPALSNTPALTTTNSFVIQVLSPPPPVLTVPSQQIIYAGQTLIVTNSATNSIFPNSIFTFGTLPTPANISINSTNGILTWTNTVSAAPSTNIITVTVSDNYSPPLGATNNFTVIIKLPNPPQLTNLLSVTNGFQFTLNTISNTTWRIDASTNLSTWLPIFTNLADTSGNLQFTDLLTTNFPRRFYRAVFQ